MSTCSKPRQRTPGNFLSLAELAEPERRCVRMTRPLMSERAVQRGGGLVKIAKLVREFSRVFDSCVWIEDADR